MTSLSGFFLWAGLGFSSAWTPMFRNNGYRSNCSIWGIFIEATIVKELPPDGHWTNTVIRYMELNAGTIWNARPILWVGWCNSHKSSNCSRAWRYTRQSVKQAVKAKLWARVWVVFFFLSGSVGTFSKRASTSDLNEKTAMHQKLRDVIRLALKAVTLSKLRRNVLLCLQFAAASFSLS